MSRDAAVVDAARALLANRADISQVHEIILRDVDANDENPLVVTLVPIGDVIGVAVHRMSEPRSDDGMAFVSASAFGNTLPALGFTASGPAVSIRPPQNWRKA